MARYELEMVKMRLGKKDDVVMRFIPSVGFECLTYQEGIFSMSTDRPREIFKEVPISHDIEKLKIIGVRRHSVEGILILFVGLLMHIKNAPCGSNGETMEVIDTYYNDEVEYNRLTAAYNSDESIDDPIVDAFKFL